MYEQYVERATAMWHTANPGNEPVQPKIETLLEWLILQITYERDKSIAEKYTFALNIFNTLSVYKPGVRVQDEIEEGRKVIANVVKVIDDEVRRIYPGMDIQILASRGGLHFAPKLPGELIQMPTRSDTTGANR